MISNHSEKNCRVEEFSSKNRVVDFPKASFVINITLQTVLTKQAAFMPARVVFFSTNRGALDLSELCFQQLIYRVLEKS